jgi:hypothetical protein
MVNIGRLRISRDAGIERIQIARDQPNIFIAFRWRCAALSYASAFPREYRDVYQADVKSVISFWNFSHRFSTALSKSVAFHYEHA